MSIDKIPLLNVTFIKDHRCFRTGESFSFRPGVNLLVGDQGSGKSTLLYALACAGGLGADASWRGKEMRETLVIELGRMVRGGYFDFEKHNPRTQPAFDMGYGYDLRFQVSSLYRSHGETVRSYVESVAAIAEPALILWDEPEGGLSPRSRYKLAAELNRTAAQGVQWLVATHCPILMGSVSEVFSLEDRVWMPPDQFLAGQQKPAKTRESSQPPTAVQEPAKTSESPQKSEDSVRKKRGKGVSDAEMQRLKEVVYAQVRQTLKGTDR